MMGRQRSDQSRLFYLFNLEARIPAHHLLRLKPNWRRDRKAGSRSMTITCLQSKSHRAAAERRARAPLAVALAVCHLLPASPSIPRIAIFALLISAGKAGDT